MEGRGGRQVRNGGGEGQTGKEWRGGREVKNVDGEGGGREVRNGGGWRNGGGPETEGMAGVGVGACKK